MRLTGRREFYNHSTNLGYKYTGLYRDEDRSQNAEIWIKQPIHINKGYDKIIVRKSVISKLLVETEDGRVEVDKRNIVGDVVLLETDDNRVIGNLCSLNNSYIDLRVNNHLSEDIFKANRVVDNLKDCSAISLYFKDKYEKTLETIKINEKALIKIDKLLGEAEIEGLDNSERTRKLEVIKVDLLKQKKSLHAVASMLGFEVLNLKLPEIIESRQFIISTLKDPNTPSSVKYQLKKSLDNLEDNINIEDISTSAYK